MSGALSTVPLRRGNESPVKLPGPAGSPGSSPAWFAFYTRARQEKKVHARFQERGLQSYLPVVPRARQWHDRVKVLEWPLYPSYVFAQFPLTMLYEVLCVPGVACVVRVAGRPVPVSQKEIDNIRRFVGALTTTGVDPEPVPLHEGQRVRIVSGPFEGIEGIVREVRGRRRVLVGLPAIGFGFQVDVATEAVALIA